MMKYERPLQFYIDGKYVDSLSPGAELFANFSPSTGEKICDVQCAQESDIERAIDAAEEGFRHWSSMTGAQRSRILMNAARLMRERREEIAHLEVLDTGKPISEALGADLPGSIDPLEYYANVAATLHGSQVDLGSAFAMVRREPLGVCAGIGAWNYPFLIAVWKSAPALACGNAMVFKPSELTPLSTLKLAEIYTEAGVPDGVFNVIPGDGKVGSYLARSPRIRKISLTGSVSTGKRVVQDSAQSLKAVTLELGGKSPLIIFEDTPIKDAVSAAMLANFYTQGEVCSHGTRVFVHTSIYSKFIEELIPRVRKIQLGDPFKMETQMGALISKAHLTKVMDAVEQGKKEGARLLCGGEQPHWPAELTKLRGGHFVTPAVFTDVQDSMFIAQEEIFGPVMSVLTFHTEEEVITRANQTPFGLAAGVFTQDLKRAHRVAQKLQAGVCWINNYNITPAEVPFGGYKMSGLGRENGMAAVDHYTQLKTIYVEMGEIHSPF